MSNTISTVYNNNYIIIANKLFASCYVSIRNIKLDKNNYLIEKTTNKKQANIYQVC